jgi:MFS family permease
MAAGDRRHQRVVVPGWITVCILCSLLVLHNAQRLAPVPLMDELRLHWGTDYTGTGNLFGAYMVTYALFSIPAGVLADRMDAKRLVSIGALLSLAASGLFALAPSYPAALVARLGLGASGAFLYVPAVRYVVSSFSADRRGGVMGFMEAGVGFGQILALAVLPFLVVRMDLARAFLSLPIFAGLILVGVSLGLRPARASTEGPAARGDFSGLVRDVRFRYLVVFHFLGMLAIYALMGWIPTFFRSEFGYSAVDAGLVAALTNVALSVFSPLAGVLSDRLGARTPVLLAGSIMLVVVLGVMMVAREPWIALVAAAVAGVAVAFSVPVLMIMVGESYGAFGAGLAVSVAGTAGQVAASLSGSVFGYTLEVTRSFAVVWGLALVFSFTRIPLLLAVGEGRHGAGSDTRR